MFPRIPKRFVLGSIVGLLIIAATAYGAILLYAPQPPLIPAPTSAELYQQQEVAEAIRTCGVYGKPQEERTTEIDGTVPLDECIQVNRKCRARLGSHAVWSGTARSDFDEAGNEELVPNCSCDDGFEFLNTDNTIGLTLDDGTVFNIIDGPGRCVATAAE